MRQTNLTGESAGYVGAREELRQAEIELMRHRERVAALRRALPPGPVVDDYVFQEGPAHPRMADDIDQRGIDLLSPVWHLLDLTPRGRGDWFASLRY
ncbi:DUF899 family protein [Streptomyces sp. NBC_01089]|uniref:DUF899 family protein n=1 Tax=Streptomyces sp. NBC_01089 TaxID=2903747 RepID=UPI0038676726|nr:DUF899 family protein [Streptomyces sp. NBC_01089]